MITSLDDLQKFTKIHASNFPIIADELILQTPGCSESEIHELLKFEPKLPPNYLKCIRKIALKGIQISGHFLPWPGSNMRKEGFVEDFREAQSNNWYHGYKKMESLDTFIAASWAGDMIGIGKIGSKLGPDSVNLFIDNDVEQHPLKLCADFETFLLAAGNVAELYNEKEKPDRDLVLLERLRVIGLSEPEIKNWHMNTEGLFGESSDIVKWRK